LRSLVSTAEQDDHHARTLDDIDPVARSVIDAYLADAVADMLDVAEIAEREPADPDIDARDGRPIAERRQPAAERFTLGNLVHAAHRNS